MFGFGERENGFLFNDIVLGTGNWVLGTGYWVLGYFVLALASASGFLGRRSVKRDLAACCLLMRHFIH